MNWEVVAQAGALVVGLFSLMFGVACFVVGILPGPSAPAWKQYGYAAVSLAAAYYLLPYAVGG